ncbi:MAG TPA: ATP synthase F1 subunit epsilon [Bacteroidales bacterium]|nr:ATP synthase F1 subunit epsilon [Bacteroidales bacterium]HPT03117.1 ATP synthase F1 subunit epsilon [Bacteroidales bacterium]
MNIEIVTPDTTIFTGEITLAQLPGLDGSFEIMNNHAPLISVLKKGRIKILNKQQQVQYFDVKGGVVEVLENKVLVLAE